MLGYRQRILALCKSVLAPYAPWRRALDFGAGEGWYARELSRAGVASEIVPVDVLRREDCVVEPLLYSGDCLPFEARSFDLTYSIDVLHHCPDPAASLRDLLRCTGKFILIKDHVCRGGWDWMMLALLDEIGNRRRGVALPRSYQRGWEWSALLEQEGFAPERLIHPAHCHPRPLSAVTDRLQFVALWRRRERQAG